MKEYTHQDLLKAFKAGFAISAEGFNDEYGSRSESSQIYIINMFYNHLKKEHNVVLSSETTK